MSETPAFPLLPADQRFLAKLDRIRAGSASPPARPRPKPRRIPAAVAATHTLHRYIWRPGSPSRRTGETPAARGPSVHDRLPPGVMVPLCTFAACSVLAAELLYLLTCRPDLHPRIARRTLVTPVDVRKVLLVRRTSLGVAAGLFRTFARRVTAD